MTHIVAIGECMLEMAPEGPSTFHSGFAGDTSNAMIYLKRAAPDFDVTYVTTPGDNPLLDADQVYVSGITVAATPQAHRETLLQWVAEAKSNGAEVTFDPNYRAGLWSSPAHARSTLEPYWQICDRFLGSDEDLAALDEVDFAAFATGLLKGSTHEVLIRRGAEPCLIFQPNHTVSVPAVNCHVIDTVGAGDAFNGTYLAARLTGINTEAAAQRAHAVAARVVQYSGAVLPE